MENMIHVADGFANVSKICVGLCGLLSLYNGVQNTTSFVFHFLFETISLIKIFSHGHPQYKSAE